jgi:hypothetical protein
MNKRISLWGYLIISLMYVLVKVVFVAFGYLHLGAILHGLVPAVLMIAAGIICWKSSFGDQFGAACFWILVLLPLLTLIITPPFMYFKQGELWLDDGRLPVLIIYEVLAVIQIMLILNLRKLKTNPDQVN